MNLCYKDLYKNMINSTKCKKDNTNKAKELEESDGKNISASLSTCGEYDNIKQKFLDNLSFIFLHTYYYIYYSVSWFCALIMFK